MPVYMCRWENGEVSFVSARSKRDACLLLDEFAAVETEDLHEVQEFMLGFALSDDGGVVLSDLGEGTRELFEEKIYPMLYEAKQETGAGAEEPVKDAGPEIRAAVEKERTGLQGRMRKRRAKSPAARSLQEELGMSATVAERHEQIARAKQDKRKLQ
jgi:hypothetical protein